MTDRYQSRQRQHERDPRSDGPRYREEDEGRQFEAERERPGPSFDWERNNRDERWQQHTGRGDYDRNLGNRERDRDSGAWSGQQDWQRSEEWARHGGRAGRQSWQPSRDTAQRGQEEYGYGLGGSRENESRQGHSARAGSNYGGTDFGSAHYYGDRGQDREVGQDYKGRGPKGYQRSDERIKEDISERLSADPRVDASEVTVDVQSGTVKLSGSVPERSMRYTMEEVCENCSGVKDVENNVRVARSSNADKSGIGVATSIGTGANDSGTSSASSTTGAAGSSIGGSRDKTK